MHSVVLGAGPAGCVAALALARRGHDVTVVDREPDRPPSGATADQIFDAWDRPAVGQFRQPHNLLGRGRAILRDDFPDVYGALLRRGAGEIHQDAFLGDAVREPGDADLATVTCRRPVLDAVLRSAVADEPGVTFHDSAVRGLRRDDHHVSGVEFASGDALRADLVVDAAGRNSPVPRWLAEHGQPPWREHTSDSHLLYYSRHYRFRDGPLPHASILGGPRGDLGYLAFAVFLGDNETFCLCIMPPAWEKDWRALRDPAAFERVARALAAAVDAAADDDDLAATFEQAVGADAAQRFAAVTAEDRDRFRLWSGQPVDPGDRNDTMPLFLRSVVYRAAGRDPEILRAVCRRINMLDPVDALATDEQLLDRAEQLCRELPPPDPPPPRTTVLAALRSP